MQGSEEERRAAEGTLVAVLEATRIVAVLLAPITPALSRRIMAQLAAPEVPPPSSPVPHRCPRLQAGAAALFFCPATQIRRPAPSNVCSIP